jgi:hypothetical protein
MANFFAYQDGDFMSVSQVSQEYIELGQIS